MQNLHWKVLLKSYICRKSTRMSKIQGMRLWVKWDLICQLSLDRRSRVCRLAMVGITLSSVFTIAKVKCLMEIEAAITFRLGHPLLFSNSKIKATRRMAALRHWWDSKLPLNSQLLLRIMIISLQIQIRQLSQGRQASCSSSYLIRNSLLS